MKAPWDASKTSQETQTQPLAAGNGWMKRPKYWRKATSREAGGNAVPSDSVRMAWGMSLQNWLD